ncbi:hypothetical protein NHX12_009526 [Muraenolepis orangiensis]|uniref:Uncharacterized protein n=1 Tax=Muraenolepis orangiensis TaxID=630683 RepID=A0A9Q0I6F9_9TELE|nr:hypothetical protein NHX12_009526 [Muraenolepis orangiensis]
MCHANTTGCSHAHGPMGNSLPSQERLLLYPDTPTKMETTSHVAFCYKPVPLPERGQRLHRDLKLNSKHPSSATASTSHTSQSRATNSAQLRGEGSERGHRVVGSSNTKQELATEDTMKSLYQKDFPPPLPQHPCRRRTPAHPQPDNIAINPSLRIEFSTIQRETYPGWPVTKHGNRSRTRSRANGRANATS